MIFGLYGEDKTCKSTLSLSFPKPILYMEFDIGGFRRACRNLPHLPIKDWYDQKQIVVKQYVMPFQIGKLDISGITPSKIVVGVKELFYHFAFDFLTALRDPNIQTIIVDTGTLLYEVTCLGYLQEKQEIQLNPDGTVKPGEKLRTQLQQQEYREPYIRMRGFVYQAKAAGKHLVLTHHATDEYGLVRQSDGTLGQGKTGKRVLHGWTQLGDGADIVGKTYVKYEPILDDGGKPTGQKKIIPCYKIELAEVKELEGMEIFEPTFDKINNLVRMIRGD